MANTYRIIHEKQREWAKSHGAKTDADGYTLTLNDNLFIPLSKDSEQEFRSGKGGELGEYGSRRKIQALHSSAALVVNFFEYWKQHNKLEIIATACGSNENLSEMHFEATHTNPVGRTAPHLDVEFTRPGRCVPLAIESKFTESYHRRTKRTLALAYIKNREIWKGLPGCESLARRIVSEERRKTSFAYLDAPQLIKHILGLTKDHGVRGFQLLYLWYGVPSLEAEKHWQELVEFESYVKNEVNFQIMTYQDLFENMRSITSVSQDYIRYLQERYFFEKYKSFLDEILAYEDKYSCLAGDVSRTRSKKGSRDR